MVLAQSVLFSPPLSQDITPNAGFNEWFIVCSIFRKILKLKYVFFSGQPQQTRRFFAIEFKNYYTDGEWGSSSQRWAILSLICSFILFRNKCTLDHKKHKKPYRTNLCSEYIFFQVDRIVLPLKRKWQGNFKSESDNVRLPSFGLCGIF